MPFIHMCIALGVMKIDYGWGLLAVILHFRFLLRKEK